MMLVSLRIENAKWVRKAKVRIGACSDHTRMEKDEVRYPAGITNFNNQAFA
jgi:hypothetical protein